MRLDEPTKWRQSWNKLTVCGKLVIDNDGGCGSCNTPVYEKWNLAVVGSVEDCYAYIEACEVYSSLWRLGSQVIAENS